MLRNTSAIKGHIIAASDGHLGTATDFLFDDATWLVRWLVVDTGTWLSGRKVFLPAFALGHLDLERNEFSVRLTKQEVRDSPNIDTKRPVSRQMEASVYDYYGWSPYSMVYMGRYNGGVMMPSSSRGSMRSRQDIAAARRSNDDPHLRSIGGCK